jgi:hypothetical protein
MKPEIALKIDYDPFKTYTRDGVEALRDEWIAEYTSIAKKYPQKEDICAYFIDRISRAAELFISRKVEPATSDATNHDDYYYEWLDEVKKEQDDTLNGDFPLGNEEDMAFASPYFSTKELAMIQMGCGEDIYAGYYVEYADRVLVRKGILAEIKGDFKEAAGAYAGVSTSKMIQEREFACRRKLKEG